MSIEFSYKNFTLRNFVMVSEYQDRKAKVQLTNFTEKGILYAYPTGYTNGEEIYETMYGF